MPIKKIERLTAHAGWALWKITESLSELKQDLPLSDEDKETLGAIKREEKQLEWLSGRLCIRALTEQQEIAYVCLKKDVHGKPFLMHEEAEISLSHSYPYVSAILNKEKPVGIDLEQPREQLLRISHKFLNPRERRHAEEDLRRLCLYWSAKEALYKIYARKKLIFNRDLEVLPFEMESEGIITGIIRADGEEHRHQLYYCHNDGYIVVFNV